MMPPRKRLGSALGASMAVHAGLVVLGVLLLSLRPEPPPAPSPAPIRTRLIYMERSGATGGGGGNPAPSPPRPLEIPEHRPAMIVPVNLTPAPIDPPPAPVLDALVVTNASAVLQGAGTALVGLPGPSGGGRGKGLGDGDGPGLMSGQGGSQGGGPRQLGAGVNPPEPTYKARPQYTSSAMQAKLTGEVALEVVVLANGTVGSARVTKSLDRVHGLDDQAVRAARLWRFTPATVDGKPVDVYVTIVLEFRIY